MEILGAVGGILLLALVVSLGIGLIAAASWVLFVIVVPIAIIVCVSYFIYQAFKTHLGRQGRDISEFLPALRQWADIPVELRQFGGYWAAVAAGLLGLFLPDLISRGGEAINSIAVISTLLIFSWAIPLAVYNLLNAPTLRNEIRFPLIAFLGGYAFSVAAHIGPVVFLFLAALTGGYGWWWYEHHPYLKMRATHQRCKELHAKIQVLDVPQFMESFRTDYVKKWGFEPSKVITEVAEELYTQTCVREVPPLPDVPVFRPAYVPGESFPLDHLETTLRDLPMRQELAISGITNTVNTYTSALRSFREPSVLTVAAADVMEYLPDLVGGLPRYFAIGTPTRDRYERNREEISRALLGEKDYLNGVRIEPSAYAAR